MTKNTTAFGGFNELADMITSINNIPKDKEQVKDMVEDVDDDIAVINDDNDVDEPVIDEPVIDEPTTDDVDEPVDVTDIDEAEPEISSYFASNLIDKLGIELDDKEKKFDKVDDVIDLMAEIIKTNSKPEFANEEVAAYDQYVRNGGSLKTLYEEVHKDSIDTSKLDLDNDKDCKLVIETNLRNLGYKEEKIKKTIERYEDADVLKDEAEDAIEQVNEFKVKKEKTLLANQEKEKIEADKQNKQFFDNVVAYVNNLKDIRGVSVDSNAKKKIIDYIFRVTPDGSTQFQKAYASDAVKNLIESAYFIHPEFGENLLNKTSKKATDDAMKKVRDKLKASKGKRNSGSGSGLGKTSPNFSSLSGLIIK
jgi:hypothetical protein